jgi:ubiquinone/menaquinone biosynthesis C-methylase UbiE
MTPPGTTEGDSFASIAPHYDALMEAVPYQLWARYIARLASIAKKPIKSGAHLLDLATGTGSVALEFAARGCHVTGIDRSQSMLDEAEKKAAERELEVTWLCRDLRDFDLQPTFDLAVCLYDSLNYVLKPEGVKRAFANIHAALKPTGLFIFDVNTIRALEAELFTQKSADNAQVKYRWKSTYDRRTCTSRIVMRFEIPATGEKFNATHYQRAYTDAEIRSFLFHAGFRGMTSYQAYTTEPPSPPSDRVFYVAHATEDSPALG